MAQFGSALEWGSRGRWFDSSHSDHPKTLKSVDFISLLGVFLFAKPSTGHYWLIVLGGFFAFFSLTVQQIAHYVTAVSSCFFELMSVHGQGYISVDMPDDV